MMHEPFFDDVKKLVMGEDSSWIRFPMFVSSPVTSSVIFSSAVSAVEIPPSVPTLVSVSVLALAPRRFPHPLFCPLSPRLFRLFRHLTLLPPLFPCLCPRLHRLSQP